MVTLVYGRSISIRFTNLPTVEQKKALRFVMFTVFIYSVGFGIIMPVLPALIMELEAVSLSKATQLGALVGASYAIAQFLMGPLVGNLSDRYGRRPVFLISLAGFSIDFLLMGFAQSVIWLFVGRAVAGGFGAIFGPANSVVADLIEPEHRAQYFGYVGAAFGIGFILGPALGGFLSEWHIKLPFFCAALLALLAFIYGYFAFPETMAKDKRREISLKRANPLSALFYLSKESSLLGLAAAYFCWLCATNIYPASWPFFSRAAFDWDSQTVGLSLTIVGMSMAMTQILLVKRLVARFRESNTAILGIAIATSFFIALAIGIPGHFVLICTVFMGMQAMVLPSMHALMSQRVSASHQGELQGLNGSLAALALLIAQLGYNSVLAHFTSEEAAFRFVGAPFVIASVFGLLAIVLLLREKSRV